MAKEKEVTLELSHPKTGQTKAFSLPTAFLGPAVAWILGALVTPAGAPILTEEGKTWIASLVGGLMKKKAAG